MLILICGIPNAGKTTFSRHFENVLHVDDYHMDYCNKLASQAEGDVCIEGIYNAAWQRKKLIQACINQSPKVCIWLDTPLEVCTERENRGRPLIIFNHNKMEIPSMAEGWNIIIRIGG